MPERGWAEERPWERGWITTWAHSSNGKTVSRDFNIVVANRSQAIFIQYAIRVEKTKTHNIQRGYFFFDLHSYVFDIFFLISFINRSTPYNICTTRTWFSFTKLRCHGPSVTFSGSLRTFDNVTSDSYPVYPVGKIGDLTEGVWSEITLRSARKVLGIAWFQTEKDWVRFLNQGISNYWPT